MIKKHHIETDIERLIKLDAKNYEVGNFFLARKLAKKLLARSDLSDTQRNFAVGMLSMTGVDRWVLASGFLSLLFVAIIAIISRY